MGWFSLAGDDDTFFWIFGIDVGVSITGIMQVTATVMLLIISFYYNNVFFFTPLICILSIYDFYFLASRLYPYERDN